MTIESDSEYMSSPKPRLKGRVTTVETVYYDLPGRPATIVESRYNHLVESAMSPLIYSKLKVNEQWQRIDIGQLDDCSILLIENVDEIKSLWRNPTPEQLEIVSRKIVEVCCNETDGIQTPGTPYSLAPQWIIKPGRSMRAQPFDAKHIYIRCRSGETICRVSILPA